MSRLEQLRDVDRLIDISKSTLQLDIILALNSRGELSPAEIASILGQRRKAVTDAMRKLRIKGLVEPASENGKSATYRLSSQGAECISVLYRFVGHEGRAKPEAKADPALGSKTAQKPDSSVPGVVGNISQLPFASALSQLLFTLGTAKGNALPIEELAGVMGLSVQRTESYLEVFMNTEPRLFRKYSDDPSWARLLRKVGIRVKPKQLVTYYGLTQEGLQQFYKLPAYTKLKRSRTYRVLSSLTRSSSPRGILRRLGIGTAFAGSAPLLLAIMGVETSGLVFADAAVLVGGALMASGIFAGNL
ncbi:MAG: MarR family winged helix-turn-helix transcriptional regulator [Candidatus Verstraetearchaeota archaeon]|nr:MarR family winged helix-turn-helix transcriptional regulator [Candidatus Verstraetearchaeota archaeon]